MRTTVPYPGERRINKPITEAGFSLNARIFAPEKLTQLCAAPSPYFSNPKNSFLQEKGRFAVGHPLYVSL
jgi:hypothetical protein